MTNPKTIDRPDVAHPTNPIGGSIHVEEDQTNFAGPVDADASKLPAVGPQGEVGEVPNAVQDELPDVGLPDGIPTVQLGMGGQKDHAPQPEDANPQRLENGGPGAKSAARMQTIRPVR